ncbi:MAG: NAD-dependent epimerase/dehydratase family protein [Saprospiraceae bacterium]|nr:NAD-dependent epimerase/dehydratase family protein [Saprospiraceae bacterium]
MKKQVAVVTGSNGFVGSHMVDYLIEKGFHVKSIVRESSNLQWLEGKDTEICKCGLMDIEAMKTVFQDADYIFHIAGTTKTKTLDGFIKGNVGLTKNVLEAALGLNNLKKIVVTSSIAAMGPMPAGEIMDEEKEQLPIDPYGVSKVEQEKLCHEYMDRLPISIIRPPVVYGERDVEVYTYFQTVNGRLRPVVGLWGKKALSMVYVINLVEGLYLAAIKDASKGQTYFLTDPVDYDWAHIGQVTTRLLNKKSLSLRIPHFIVYTVAGISQLFSKITGKATLLNIDKARQMVAASWMCTADKARKELDYKGAIELEEGFKNTIDWYKEKKWLK